jgi:nicotinamidase-related amidase
MRVLFLSIFFSATLAAVLIGSESRSRAEPEVKLPVLDLSRTALVVTDPQNDFLSPQGATWKLVGKSVEQNGTVPNIESLFKAAKGAGVPVFISPHYYYPHDKGWQFGGKIEQVMKEIGMFGRKGPLTAEGFQGSGADWLERYKPYIEDDNTIVCSPHKVYGPESNDLVLQLRDAFLERTGDLPARGHDLCATTPQLARIHLR